MMNSTKKVKDLKVNHVIDMYKWYIEEKMKKDPTLCTRYDSVLAMKGYRILVRPKFDVDGKHLKGKDEIIMTYTLFRSILEKCNTLIIDTILEGEQFYFGNSLGHLEGARIERNFKKKVIDRGTTFRLRKELNDPSFVAFHTGDSYCRIAWKKIKTLRTVRFYKLDISYSVRSKFSNALLQDELLQYKFTYYKRP